MITATPYALISCDTPETGNDESRRTWFEHKLVQLYFSFRRVTGSYKGKPEVSYLVLIESETQRAALLRLAKAFKQESVLFVDANGYAALFDADGTHLAEVGKWQVVTEEVAAANDAYTFVDGNYYIAGAK